MNVNDFIKELCEELNCLSYAYYDDIIYDKGKNCNIQMIHQISFSRSSTDEFIFFINSIKYNKYIYIDCIYAMQSNKCRVLFASKFYCKNNMSKQSRKSYLENEIFSEEESKILNTLSIKK